jgi:hypothetical protein
VCFLLLLLLLLLNQLLLHMGTPSFCLFLLLVQLLHGLDQLVL